MAHEMPASVFAAKTWIYYVQAVLFGGIAFFSLILGPLFLFQVMLDERGRPAPNAGIALMISSIPFLCFFALAVFSIMARRQPLIRLFREGIVVRQIGATSVNWFFFVPGLIRVAWLIVSGQGFKQRTYVLPWESFSGAYVSGMPMDETLTLSGACFAAARGPTVQAVVASDQIDFAQVEFILPLRQIADAINLYHQSDDSRGVLPSWTD